MITKIPYGKTCLEYDFQGARIIESRINELRSGKSGEAIVREAMASPIGAPELRKLAERKRTACILLSDHTRPVPSKIILPLMIEELKAGNPDIKITMLVARGTHRKTTEEEIRRKVGEEIHRDYKIIMHDSRDAQNIVHVGTLPSGAPFQMNKFAYEQDLLISEGFIDPHFFAGFSGGRKSVLPGISSYETVYHNHCSELIDSDMARTGKLDGNPVHEDMLAAAKLAKLAFIVNVVLDQSKNVVAAFAGDAQRAHRAGCDFLKGYCVVQSIPGDIVVTSNGGEPSDQNVYQCVKGLTAAEATGNPGAVIVMCANCGQGHGGDDFFQLMQNCSSAQELYAGFMKNGPAETTQDQWQCQILARVLKKHPVIFVTRLEMQEQIEQMKFEYAGSLEAAMQRAYEIKGKGVAVTVIPNGVSVIVE